MPIKIPIQLDKGRFVETTDEEESIIEFLKLLISSPQGCFLADSNFGFSLVNHRFETIDKNVNTFLSIDMKSADKEKRIFEKSKNKDTFAQDIAKTIEKYEPRIESISVEDPDPSSEDGIMKTIFTIEGKLNGKPFSHKEPTYFW